MPKSWRRQWCTWKCMCMHERVCVCCVGGDLLIVVQLHVLFIYVQLMQLKQHVTIRDLYKMLQILIQAPFLVGILHSHFSLLKKYLFLLSWMIMLILTLQKKSARQVLVICLIESSHDAKNGSHKAFLLLNFFKKYVKTKSKKKWLITVCNSTIVWLG